MKLRTLFVFGLPLAVALALHLPDLNAPFGPGSTNGGSFFGVYARNFERHGLLNLRGLPVFNYGLQSPAQGIPYLNHPPLVFWMTATGARPWNLRLPNLIAQLLLVALLTFRAFSRGRDDWVAFLTGLAMAVMPIVLAWVDVAYEPWCMAVGLLLLLRARAFVMRPSRLRFFELMAIGAIGILVDWPFAFYAVGLFPLAFQRGKFLAAVIAACGVALGLAIGLWAFFAWAQFAAAGPLAPPTDGLQALRARFTDSVKAPPEPMVFLQAIAGRIREGFGPFLIVPAVIGLPFAIKRDWRWTIGFMTAALLALIVPAEHAMGHIHFTAYLALPFALGIGALGRPWAGVLRWLMRGLLIGCLVVTAWMGFADRRAATHPFFERLGQALDAAQLERDEAGAPKRLFQVHYNLPYAYAYYIEGPFSVPGVPPEATWAPSDPPGPLGLKVLALEWRVSPETAPFPRPRESEIRALEAKALAVKELPSLCGPLFFPDGDIEVDVFRARLFTLKP